MKGINITPTRLAAQWAHAAHKFQINVHNFEVKAGQAAVEVFQVSFDMQRLNSRNSAHWAGWQGSYVGHGSLMNETGTLRNSIKVKSIKKNKITIHTDPAAFSSSARHKGFCYAKVHNNLSKLAVKPGRGPKKERQFIGYSTVLDEKIKELINHVFDGLPR